MRGGVGPSNWVARARVVVHTRGMHAHGDARAWGCACTCVRVGGVRVGCARAARVRTRELRNAAMAAARVVSMSSTSDARSENPYLIDQQRRRTLSFGIAIKTLRNCSGLSQRTSGPSRLRIISISSAVGKCAAVAGLNPTASWSVEQRRQVGAKGEDPEVQGAGYG